MGAETSILENCEIGAKLPLKADVDWVVQEAVQKNPNLPRLAIFTKKKKDCKREVDIIALNAKQLKVLRHPAIVRYILSGHSADGSYLVTEFVKPLETVTKDLSPVEICSGFYNIIDALVFLHETVEISHNNICQSSIFVTKDGTWKLGGFEHACHFEQLTPKFLENCRALRSQSAISPEEKADNLCISSKAMHVLDAYSFGKLAEEFFDQLKELGDLFKTFELRIQDEYLSRDPKQRPPLKCLLTDRLFKYENHFLEVKLFLKNITLKSSEEKTDFFSQVVSMLQEYSEELVGSQLIHLLLSRFVVLNKDAEEFLLPSLLIPQQAQNNDSSEKSSSTPCSLPIFSKPVFKKYVIPELVNIFKVREVHIRLLLLKYFRYYVELFEKEEIEEVIFPQLLLGLRDVNDKLVSASLHAVADLVPILGGDTVIGGPQKQYFKEGKPKNVQSVIKEEKLTSVKQALKKPLLKDLAASIRSPLRKSNKHTDEETDKKHCKVILENNDKAAKVIDSVPKKDFIIEDNSVEVKITDPSAEVIYEKYKPDDPDNWVDWDNPEEWDDDEKNQYFEREIEAELAQMSSVGDSVRNKKQLDNEILRNAVNDIHLNSADVTSVNNTNSKLDETWSSTADFNSSWAGDQPSIDSNLHALTVIKTHSRQEISPNSLHYSANVSKNISAKQLGEEFDIMNIKVPKKSQEIDYFADMQPVISSSSKAELSEIALSTSHSDDSNFKEEQILKSSLSFAISEDAAEVNIDGWGDDLNWEEINSKIN
ncbi:protein-associating with the carboxyl-terminal domain of ezrin-like [Octopus vulgaris]|uniref:Protein-associating with the carboxyl-terminal domain of ezrin-like n=1 Tax=Octopus vulgaris TaxID=6645 RepID=A0AA36AIB4_OCTVU|nr:protein-associating with the carboxyl-terminal domain of ezrin-like [Octopus vulgaris]